MSVIDPQLTRTERQVLAMYRNPATSGMGRAVRLSIQYAIGGAVFLYLAIATGNPWYSVVIYATFVAWMIARLLGGKKLAGVMPAIIDKYEERIQELEKQVNDGDAT